VRWLLIFLFAIAALWYFRGADRVPPPKAENTLIGEPVKALLGAESYEKSYLEAVDEHQKKVDKQSEEESGG